MRRLFILLIILLGLLPSTVQAQTEEPTPPPSDPSEGASIPLIHTVQEGENLTYIAESYGTTVSDLLAVNNLAEDAILAVGQTLIIPGGEGESVAAVYTAQVGDTLTGVAAAFNTSVTEVLETNRMINPALDLVVGQELAVISKTGSADPQTVLGIPHVVAEGETLLTLAARYNLSPGSIGGGERSALSSLSFHWSTAAHPGRNGRVPRPAW